MKAKDIIGARVITNEDGSGIVDAGKRLVGKKLLPAVGFTDAALRANDEDWVGAGIGTVAGGLGLVPPTSPYGIAAQAGSISLDALNQLRDLAKERGGWGNLGKDMYQSIKTQGYDPSFLPEDFEELDRLDEQGLLEELGGLRGLLIRKGIDVADYLKNLVTRKKPDAPKPEVDVTPPKAPDVTPPPVKDRGEIDITKEFKRIEAERIAKAEAEAAERAAEAAKKIELEKAAEAERLKNIKVPRKRPLPLETEKGYIRRLEKMGPEYAAKHRQEIETQLKMRQLAQSSPLGFVKDLGKTVLKYGSLGGSAALGYKYGPDVADWALDKSIKGIEDMDTTGAKLPFPAPAKQPPAPAPSNSTDSSDTATDKSAPAVPAAPEVFPSERPGVKMYGDQSRAPDKAEPLSEKQEKYSKDQYIEWAAKYAKMYDVPVSVVLHAMYKETGWIGDADRMRVARNPASGATGVMQILPQYSKDYGIKPGDLTNPEKNIQAGARMLAKHFNTYGDAAAALAAYNWGPNSKQFKQWVQTRDVKLLPAETRKYIYGDPKKKDSVAYSDDPKIQLAALKPETKLAAAGNDVLAALTGSGNAQAVEKSVTPKASAEKAPAEPAATNSKLVPIDKRIAGRMENLDPVFRQRLEKALANYPGELRVTSANRLPHEQNKLYQAFINGLSQIPASKELASHAGYAIDVDRDDLAKFHKWLQAEKKAGKDYELETGLEWGKNSDPVHLQARNWQKIEQEQRVAKKEQDRLDKEAKNRKQQRDTDTRIAQAEPQKAPEKKAEKPADKIDPLTGARAAQAEPAEKPAEKPADKPATKSKAPVEVPSVDDFGNVIEPGKITKPAAKPADKPVNKPADKTPKAKTYTTTDTQGKTTTYTQNEKGQWVDPSGNILPMPEKPGSRPADKPVDKKTDNKSSATKSDAPDLTPKKVKPDSDLSKPAPTVSDKTAPPKSEPPKQAPLVIPPGLKDRIAKDSNKRADANAPLVIPPELKDRIDKDSKNKADANPPVVIPSELKNLEKNTARKDFEQAFKAARDEKGPGNTFNWKNPLTGKEGTYTTDYKQEKKNAQPAKTPIEKTDQEFDTKSSSLVDKETDKKSDNKSIASPVDTNVIDALTKKDSWNTEKNAPSIKIDLATGNATDKEATLSPVTVDAKPEKTNVWRDSSGKPVTNRYGEPWGTGTSDKDDIEAAKIELQQQAEIDKAKGKLQAISPDLSKPPESSWKDIWDKGIENLTGKKRMTKDELNTIRVPESINNELDDILRLAGRKK